MVRKQARQHLRPASQEEDTACAKALGPEHASLAKILRRTLWMDGGKRMEWVWTEKGVGHAGSEGHCGDFGFDPE